MTQGFVQRSNTVSGISSSVNGARHGAALSINTSQHDETFLDAASASNRRALRASSSASSTSSRSLQSPILSRDLAAALHVQLPSDTELESETPTSMSSSTHMSRDSSGSDAVLLQAEASAGAGTGAGAGAGAGAGSAEKQTVLRTVSDLVRSAAQNWTFPSPAQTKAADGLLEDMKKVLPTVTSVSDTHKLDMARINLLPGFSGFNQHKVIGTLLQKLGQQPDPLKTIDSRKLVAALQARLPYLRAADQGRVFGTLVQGINTSQSLTDAARTDRLVALIEVIPFNRVHEKSWHGFNNRGLSSTAVHQARHAAGLKLLNAGMTISDKQHQAKFLTAFGAYLAKLHRLEPVMFGFQTGSVSLLTAYRHQLGANPYRQQIEGSLLESHGPVVAADYHALMKRAA